jgi:ATP synthase protein I
MANMVRRIGTLAMLQLALIAATSVIFFMIYGAFQAGSVWFGGLIAMTSAQWLEWRRRRVDQGPALSAGESMRVLYRTALERFVWVLLLFALGLGVLQLDPVALITGFIVGQLALLLTGIVGTD